jgi:hypothetical protein
VITRAFEDGHRVPPLAFDHGDTVRAYLAVRGRRRP